MAPPTMFTGIFTYSVDQKGRIVMPGKFLESLGNPFVLASRPAGCLVAAGTTEHLEQAGGRGYVECHVRDRTGRFVIPNALREFADLKQSGEAAVVGVGDEVEIWSKRRWESQARLSTPPTPAREQFSLRSGTLEAPSTPFISIRAKKLYGQPYLEMAGSLSRMETDRALAHLEAALRERPQTIFLDLRNVDTVDASFLIAMDPAARQLAATGGRMAILTERTDVAQLIHRLCGPGYTRVFDGLEAALWWLVEEGHA